MNAHASFPAITFDDRLYHLGQSLKQLSRDRIAEARTYSADTPVQKSIRIDLVKKARRAWRDGLHYERTYGA